MHRIHRLLMLLAVTVATLSFGDETPVSADLDLAKGYLARAEQGDAEAMYLLGDLLMRVGPEPGHADAQTLEAWRPVGNRYTAMKWIQKAADLGQAKARAILCSVGKDPLAPASRREAAAKYCD